jgi:hypothetical protein
MLHRGQRDRAGNEQGETLECHPPEMGKTEGNASGVARQEEVSEFGPNIICWLI